MPNWYAMHGSVMICVEMGADGYCMLSSVFKIHSDDAHVYGGNMCLKFNVHLFICKQY